MREDGGLQVRPLERADRVAVIELCRRSLGWNATDPNEAFFRWKHDENPFGPSHGWVAVADDGHVVGLRVFMRWRFRDHQGRTFEAVRAVDTATDPAWQGRGIFTRLTLGALPDLADSGVRAVFNTPNDKSRPGYLKMGWTVVGRLGVLGRPRTVGSIMRSARSRAPAELWSEATTAGRDAGEVFARDEAADLLAATPARQGLSTDRSIEFMRWRYGFGPLRYRVLPVGDELADGAIVFRVRRRGASREVAVVDILGPLGAPVGAALGRLLRETQADHLVALDPWGGVHPFRALRHRLAPISGFGPILTWRPLDEQPVPSVADLALTLGDIELF